MTPDPVVEEIKRYRHAQAARFGYDLVKIAEDARRRQGTDGRQVVRLSPRPPRASTANQRSAS